MSNPVNIVLGLEGANAIASGLESVIVKFAGLAGVVATVNKVLNGVANALNLGGTLKDLSDRTGETVGNVVVLRRELDATGVSADNLGQIAGLLQRSLAGVNEDGTATAATFAQLNLSMGRLRQMPLVEQIDAVGAALRALPTQADRADAAMRLFGRSGTQLLPLLLDGGALAQARREAGGLADEMERNAVSFDRVGDKVGAFQLKLTEAYTIIAARLLPLAERLVDVMNGLSGSSLANGLQRGVEVALLVGGYAGLQKLFKVSDNLFLDWATRPGAAVANSIGNALVTFRGALAKILPWGLAAALAVEIGLGIYQAQSEAAARRKAVESAPAERAFGQRAQLGAIRTEEDEAKFAAAIQKQLEAAEAEIKRLTERSASQVTVSSPMGPPMTTTRGLTDDEQAQLSAAKSAKGYAESFQRMLADLESLKKIKAANQAADAEAEAKQQASAKAAKERYELETQLIAAQSRRDQPEIDRLQRAIEEKKIREDLRGIEEKGVATAGLVESRLAARDALLKNQRDEVAELFDLATQQLEAEQAANVEQQKKLALLEKEKAYRKVLTGPGAEPLIQERLAADAAAIDRQNAQAANTAKLTTAEAALTRIQEQRGLITQSQLLDEATKRRRLAANVDEYRAALAKVIELKLEEQKLAVGAGEQARIEAEIAALRSAGASYGAADTQPTKFQATSNAYADRNAPTQSYQGGGEAIGGGAMEFVTSLGSAVNAVAEAVNSVLNASLAGTSNALNGLFSGAMTFKDAWGSAIQSVRAGFERAAADMVAKMIWRATIERALIALGVTSHVTGEQTKTASTVAGGAIRLGVWIKEAIVSVYKGAIAAFDALASIPYVGPFLGAAAMVAAIAGGMALVGKMREHGGPVRKGESYVVGEKRAEVFVPDQDGTIVPSVGEFARNQQAAMAARGAALQGAANNAAAARTQATGQAVAENAPQRPLALHNHFDQASLRKALFNSEAEDFVVKVLGNNMHKFS